MLCASVMRGTAILPRSDEVCVNIVRSEFVRVDVRLALKVCRSGKPLVKIKRPLERAPKASHTLIGFRLSYFRADDPVDV